MTTGRGSIAGGGLAAAVLAGAVLALLPAGSSVEFRDWPAAPGPEGAGEEPLVVASDESLRRRLAPARRPRRVRGRRRDATARGGRSGRRGADPLKRRRAAGGTHGGGGGGSLPSGGLGGAGPSPAPAAGGSPLRPPFGFRPPVREETRRPGHGGHHDRGHSRGRGRKVGHRKHHSGRKGRHGR